MSRIDYNKKSKTRNYRARSGRELKNTLQTLERKREQSRTLTLSLFVGLALVAMIGMIILLTKGTAERPNLEFVNIGSIEHNEPATALIVREEQLLYAPISGRVTKSAEEGGKVRKQGMVATVIEEESAPKLEELYAIEDEIAVRQNQLVRQGNYKDINLLYSQSEADLSGILRNIRRDVADNNLSEILDRQAEADRVLAERKASLLNTDLSSPELDQLMAQRSAIQEILSASSQPIYTPEAGTISYATDGLEETLDFAAAEQITPEQLREYLEQPDTMPLSEQTIEAGEPVARLVTDIRQYLIVRLPNLKTTYFDQNRRTKVQFRLAGENVVIQDCIIDRIVADGDGTMLVLRTDREVGALLDRRIVEGSLRTSYVSGLKVPKDAIIRNTDDASLGSVMAVQRGYTARVPIRILETDRTHSIIESVTGDNTLIEGSIIVVNPDSVEEGEFVE